MKKYHETGEFDKNEIYPYKIEGLGKNLIPSVTDFEVIDQFIKVGDEESAKSARDLVKKEGIFGGYTTGACLRAVEKLIEKVRERVLLKTGTNLELEIKIVGEK